MQEIRRLLDEAFVVIDSECDSHTAEYRALDLLRRALRRLATIVEDLDRG